MDTIFMSSENSIISDPYRILRNLPEKIDSKTSNKYVALSNLDIQYTWKNMKRPYKSKLKISAATWNYNFKIPEGSYSVSDIQDCF